MTTQGGGCALQPGCVPGDVAVKLAHARQVLVLRRRLALRAPAGGVSDATDDAAKPRAAAAAARALTVCRWNAFHIMSGGASALFVRRAVLCDSLWPRLPLFLCVGVLPIAPAPL